MQSCLKAVMCIGECLRKVLNLLDVLYLGVKLGIYPCLIFMGVGCMTDFGPLIANPKSLLLGAAAQLGIFVTYVGCQLCWASPRHEAPPSASSAVRTARRRSSSPPSSPRSARPHRRCRVFLHGARSGHSAADHEGSDHQERAQDRHEASCAGPRRRRSSSPLWLPCLWP